MQEIIVNVYDNKNKIIGLVENGKLVEKYEETSDQERLEGNIYIGKVKNILIGMQAAFIDIGKDKNSFIHIRDIIPKVSNETGNKNELLSKHDIKEYIKEEMPILVQVKRDETNKKGARVSTHISISGRFSVVMPNTNFITVSQKIENNQERERLKGIVRDVLPEGYGVIVRTSAEGKDEEKIIKDIKQTIKKIEEIFQQYENLKADKKSIPQLIYQNDDLLKKTLKDLIDHDIQRILTNDSDTYKEIEKVIKETENEEKIKLEQKEDLLSIYNLSEQLEDTKNRKIWLKCGGCIIIDKTEALTAIDVNSAKYTGKKDLEQTVFTVNKEATIEIAKQLRLRDIGGIIIIDYIDMEQEENKEKVIQILKDSLKKDRSKTQVVGFTTLNLLEMTRKHICSNN